MTEKDWVIQQWKGSEFGNKRLEKRVIELGKNSLKHAEKSLPKKFQDWSGLKAVYRFFNSEFLQEECA